MPIMKWGYVIKYSIFLLLILMPLICLSANEANYETDVTFRDFPWGTSQQEFIKKMGNPVSKEEINGLSSLIWENIDVNGYTTYMLAYFSKKGLEGGTYYFLTYDMDQLMRCYSEIRLELRERFGPTNLFNGILRELRPYQCVWDLPGGYVHLKVNTRQGDPVTLWYSSPDLTRQVMGN